MKQGKENELIRQLELIRHTQIIKDPFIDDKTINIYKAYQKGYDKAYEEIREGFLKHAELNRYIEEGMNTAYNQMREDIKNGFVREKKK